MNKAKAIFITIALIIICNLVLLVTIPGVVVPVIESANATMAATSNMSNYPGTSDFMVASPWLAYLMVNAIGVIVVIMILRRPA